MVASLVESDLAGRLRTLDHGLELEELDLGRLLVEVRLDLVVHAELAARGGDERLFERLDHDLTADPLVLADLVDDAL